MTSYIYHASGYGGIPKEISEEMIENIWKYCRENEEEIQDNPLKNYYS